MKKSVITKFFAVLIVLSVGLSAQVEAQYQSDRQVLRNFEQDIRDANRSIRTIETVAEADSLLDVVNNLPSKYDEQQDFLNRVLFPETVRGTVQDLRENAQVTRERIRRIEEQGENVVVLESRIEELRESVTERTEQLESLRAELDQMARSRNVSAQQARNFREALRERDEFILDLIDSIFVAYDRIDLASLSADERRAVALDINVDNVFGHIESVISNNIDFLDTHTQLSSEDFLRLYAVQAEFQRMWSNLGSKLGELYVDAERAQRVRDINSQIGQWGSKIDENVWASVNASFQEREIDLGNFSSAVSFNTALNSYLNSSVERAREGGSDEEYARYQNFASVWHGDVKTDWQEYMVDANLMSYRDFVSIDEQLAEWKVLSQPRSYATLMYLGLSLVVILILLVLWIRERSKNKATA